MIIGHFRYDAGADLYTGAIRTLAFSHDQIVLRPIAKASEREPDYRVLQASEAGEVEFGAAWARRSERGQDYLSVLLDGPTLPQALNLALFPGDRDDAATLVWTRPQRKAAADPHPAPQTAPSRNAAPSRKATVRGPAHG